METSLRVNLGERSYDLHFGTGADSRLRADLDAVRAVGRRVAVVTDENLAAAQAPWLNALAGPVEIEGAFPRLVLPAGEATKCLGELGQVWNFLAAQRLDRSSLLLAVGGGVIGDLAGFAAASYLRGIPLIQVPTTLLAMVDSSVGGKTGINLSAGKIWWGPFTSRPPYSSIQFCLLRCLRASLPLARLRSSRRVCSAIPRCSSVSSGLR